MQTRRIHDKIRALERQLAEAAPGEESKILVRKLEDIMTAESDRLLEAQLSTHCVLLRISLLAKAYSVDAALESAVEQIGRIEEEDHDALVRTVEGILSEADSAAYEHCRPFLLIARGVVGGELLNAALNVCDVPHDAPEVVELIRSFLDAFDRTEAPTVANFRKLFDMHLRDQLRFNRHYRLRVVENEEVGDPEFETARWRNFFEKARKERP